MVFSRIPIAASWALLGRNIFDDSNAYLLPILSIFICIAMTYIATIDVNKFSELADFGGKITLAATVICIEMALVVYFSGTYIVQTENPKKNFPKAIIIATIFIALSYILG